MPVADTYSATPLLDATDLADFPGAPFSPSVVQSAAGTVRDVAGWHIAPEVTETLTLDSDGGRTLMLPTLHLVDVTAIRDVTDPDNPKVLDDWRKTRIGMLYRAGGWPLGFETVEVDLVHGYTTCPPSLLSVVADIAGLMSVSGAISQETSGQESASYRSTARRSPALAGYTIRAGA